MSVTNRYGAEEVTHTLLAESRAETQRWMEAFWQHFYDMSACGDGDPDPSLWCTESGPSAPRRPVEAVL